ncbi:hypothetical protein [Cohnella yongneupensis]|uniref:hypothetical protein n=1 Tax=Cohnella yongneupensis TaxID=425006 RepID=UPI003671BA8B
MAVKAAEETEHQSPSDTPTGTPVNPPSPTAIPSSTEAVATEANTVDNEIDAYWKDFASKIMFKEELYQEFEEKPLAYYVAGLSNSDPLIRWYCAYKITDYADRLTDTDRQAIASLTNDPDADVARAASFSNSLITATYEGEAFARSSDGQMAAYYKFQEARFNDGKVFLVRDGHTEQIFKDPSIISLAFSPNNRYLFVGNGGRIWQAAHVYDLTTNEWIVLPNMIDGLIDAKGSVFEGEVDPAKIDGVYQWVRLQEWSPEGDRFLYFYHFSVDNQDQEGYAIVDLKKNAVMHVMPMKEDGSSPLDTFKW